MTRRWRFTLRGARALTFARLSALLSRVGGPVAWGRPGAVPLVVLTASDFAEITGRAVPATTFAPSRFCRVCARFTGGRGCLDCEPPTTAARRAP